MQTNKTTDELTLWFHLKRMQRQTEESVNSHFIRILQAVYEQLRMNIEQFRSLFVYIIFGACASHLVTGIDLVSY